MKETYCNPVPFRDGKRHTNPDPFVLRWCGKYYCYATDEFGVKVSVSENLTVWEALGYAISEPEYHHYWAPSVLYRNGIFYMYYSNIPIEEPDCHQQHLKLATAKNPEGPFQYRKTFFDQFSIDSHPVIYHGKQYLFYSVNDWLGTEEKVSGTCILADEMTSPDAFRGRPVPVLGPSLKQEIYAADRFGDGRDWYTIEGACPVFRDGKCWLLYSANAYENTDYFVGTAVAENKKELCKMKWEKYPDDHTWMPLLCKNELVEGTGHNTVTKAPNLADDWIVYHGRSALEELKTGIEQREMRIDRLYFSGGRMFCHGPSAREDAAPNAPFLRLGQMEIRKWKLFGEAGLFYRMELWISAEKQHIGARIGILLAFQDESNYVEVQIYTGQRELRALSCRNGIRRIVKTKKLPGDFDYTVPHLLFVQRSKDYYEVRLDDACALNFHAITGENAIQTGIVPYFTNTLLHSMSLSLHARLSGKRLEELGYFYQAQGPASLSQKGLNALAEEVSLTENEIFSGDYTEEFQLEVTSADNYFRFSRGGKTLLAEEKKQGTFSIYHGVENGKEWFLSDGKLLSDVESTLGAKRKRLCLKGLRILSYRCTKN